MDRKKNEVIGMVRRYLARAKNNVKIEKAILFGSRANETQRTDSDIDLLIISKDFEGEKSYKRAPRFFRTWNLPYDGDIICLTPLEFEKKKKQIGIIKTASEEGIEIQQNHR